MKVLRTSDERFSGLPGYDFSPHYVEITAGDGEGMLRVHYLDEGPGRRRGDRSAPARRAVLELSLPAHDPPPDGGRVPGGRP
jgi:hypothetical protein